MTGYIDRATEGCISGWAMNLDRPGEPMLLTIIVNGRAVATVLAAHQRDDVAEAFGGNGGHGFFVDLTQCGVPPGPILVDVRGDDGTALPNSPLWLTVPPPARQRQTTVLFMHIPKTAGTAFRETIEANYNVGERLYLYPDATVYAADLPVWRVPLDHRARLRFVMGHFPYGMHIAFPQPCEYVSVIRRPLDRLVSLYFHWVRNSPDVLARNGRPMSFTEMLARCHDTGWDNLMVRYFAGDDAMLLPPGAVDESTFQLAMKNIRERFAYIGIQENSPACYEALARRYGWERRQLERSNVGGGMLQPGEQRPAEEMVSRTQAWDIRLHQNVVAMFGHNAGSRSGAMAGVR